MNSGKKSFMQLSYSQQSSFHVWKIRVPWLILLMLSTTFTSIILSAFENRLFALSNGTMLYAFIPMLMGTSGNAGGQTSSMLIRAIALNQIHRKNAIFIFLKELFIAFLVALTLAVFCFLKLTFLDSLYVEGITFKVSFIISLVLFISVLTAKTVGCALPLIATILHVDPAVVVGPFMCTIVDALSLIFYCSFCVFFL